MARRRGTPAPGERQTELAAALADLVLAEGLGGLALREVGARLGISDRMLIYHFGTKERLVSAMLDEVGRRLGAILAARGGGPRVSAGAFLDRVLGLAADPEVAPFMRLWTEVIARGARGETPYDRVAPEVVRSWTGWIGERLEPEGGAEDGRAGAILAIVEGIGLLELAAPGSTRGAQGFLARALDGSGPDAPGEGDTGRNVSGG